MENKMKIRKETSGTDMRIYLEGRLDANGAGYLEDYLNILIREGSYRLILNLTGVQYISSAGIRILVSQYKKIKNIDGLFVLEALSVAVSEILNMVGLKVMLTEEAHEPVRNAGQESRYQEINRYRFGLEKLSDEKMIISFTGNPQLIIDSGFTVSDNHKIKFRDNQYGLGLGAIGEGFEDCKKRYGEFIAIGESLIYKPSDGSKIPDYIVKTGSFEPEINSLYSIQAEGVFSGRITFEQIDLIKSISLEELADGFAKATGLNQFMFLVIAESDGMIGVSLNAPPVEGRKLFEYPGICEDINFTTEPAYSRMLTVSLGFYALIPEDRMKSFLRPIKHGSSVFMHTHSAVFPFQALTKNEMSAGKLVLHLLESSIVQDVLHLINDTREISGSGSSLFKQGVAWIGKIS
jgi:anti-anti-sigma factor